MREVYLTNLVGRLVTAAEGHGIAAGETAMGLGDLEVLLGAAVGLLDGAGLLPRLWEDAGVRELIGETPEYDELATEIYGDAHD